MGKPRVAVSNYGAGDNSVLVVNRAITEGIRDAGLMCADLTYKGSHAWEERQKYNRLVPPMLRQHVEEHGPPDVIVAQAAFARELFLEAQRVCPSAMRVLQRDSTHIEDWKALVDAEMGRVLLPDLMGINRSEVEEYELADRITVLSRWVERSFRARGYGEIVEYVGPQVIDDWRWQALPRRPDGVQLRVMVAGQLRVAKGTHLLCRAWRALDPRPDEELMLVGLNTQQGREQRFIDHEVSTTPRCRLVGWQRLEDMPAWYRACDVYCLPSVQEGSSMTCTEAMACGRPVVAPENAGCDLLEENDGRVGFLVPASDHEALAATLRRYRERPGLAAEQGVEAARAAQAIGGVERFGRGYAAALRRMWLDWNGR